MAHAKVEPVVQLSVRIPASLRLRMKVYAARSGIPVNALIAEGLTALLDAEDRAPHAGKVHVLPAEPVDAMRRRFAAIVGRRRAK